jgi:RNA polymerase sigma-70 factor (ECF subfamily)
MPIEKNQDLSSLRAHDVFPMPTDTLDFQSVHDRFRPRVLRYVARLAGGGDADDLAQQVMLRISEGLPRFRGESSLSTWIYRIATNVALDHLRRKAVPAPIDLADLEAQGKDPPEARTESVEATAIRDEMSACIREFVERLPQDYRTVMVLAELEGFRNAEIAAVLGVSLDTVKIRLHRAREKLRRDLEAGCSFSRDESAGLACERSPTAVVKFRRPG